MIIFSLLIGGKFFVTSSSVNGVNTVIVARSVDGFLCWGSYDGLRREERTGE